MCVLSSCVPYRYLLRCGWLNDTGMSPNFPKWRELYQSAVQKVKGCTILVPKLFFNQSMKCNIDQCFQYYYCISRCTNGRTENPCVAGSIPALATKSIRNRRELRFFCFNSQSRFRPIYKGFCRVSALSFVWRGVGRTGKTDWNSPKNSLANVSGRHTSFRGKTPENAACL